MAVTPGKMHHKETGLGLVSSLLILIMVPCLVTALSRRSEIKLTVADDTKPGATVLKGDIIVEKCVEMFHIKKSPSTTIKPFHLQKDGSVVTDSSISDVVGDLVVLKPKTTDFCQTHIPVSLNIPIHLEIVPSYKKLSFLQSQYRGFVPVGFARDTKVQGIRNLYACHLACRNNIEYTIVGTDDFYLQTVSKSGHIQLEIYVKDAQAVSKKQNYNLLIMAEDADGLRGHASVHIDVAGVMDDNLYFRSEDKPHRRQRRQLPIEYLQDRSVQESASGNLFSIANSTTRPNYTYRIKSSTYSGAFAVTSSGNVSVTQGFTLDYEALTNKTVLVIFEVLTTTTTG